MAVGDGAFVRAILDAVVEFLRHFASPTGARGSVLLMKGGLVVLGFLFLAFVFRSAIVGDLAPTANGRTPLPRSRLPWESLWTTPARGQSVARDFTAARQAGRASPAPTLDAVIEMVLDQGNDARIIESDATRKRVRFYQCASCGTVGGADCERERGLLAGGFEALTGCLAKVEETACRRRGAAYCEFEVKHQALVQVRT
ncbi:MAG: V4R domain-containing protein [Candidatus Thermoplasmatota archaeon]